MAERLLITVAAIALFAGVFLLAKRRQIALANHASRQMTKQNNLPTIVYFWSDGCPVCKGAQRPVLEGILAEYGKEHVAFTAYNIDTAPGIAKEWGVMTLPTTLLLDAAGAIKYVNNGLIVAETLRKQLELLISRRDNGN